MTLFSLVQLVPSGDIFLVRNLTTACGPLAYTDWQDDDTQQPRADLDPRDANYDDDWDDTQSYRVIKAWAPADLPSC